MPELFRETVGERIAIYGGSFDPVHNAHLVVATACLDGAELDRVLFVPAAQSPLKDSRPNVSNEVRVEMLELATRSQPAFHVSPFELEKGGVSYSIETVLHFRKEFPGAELFLMIGGDQFELLSRWHRINELAGVVAFLVVARPGYKVEPDPSLALHFQVVDAPLLGVSSSLIREYLRHGKSIDSFVPEEVARFIVANRLYR